MKKRLLTLLLSLSIIVIAVGGIDLGNLFNYMNQPVPTYIIWDNTTTNPISDAGATLGRVLFYDKQMSIDGSTSCASCHRQEFAFGDTAIASVGWNGTTSRHSMRLVNARFSEETNFFWDERASSLEDQATQPIQDHIEMGFSGLNGDPDIDSLIRRMEATYHYQYLFDFVFGDTDVTEQRLQVALAQFIRSIQSFDSRFDDGLVAVNGNLSMPFPNFTPEENAGKELFLFSSTFDPNGERVGGGAGCQRCHRAPEFDIATNARNNGHVTSLDGTNDFTNTRAPSLRDLFDPDGIENGPMMHDGAFATFDEVLEHYNNIPDVLGNTTLDPRLNPQGNPQKLNLTAQEKLELTAFLKTLTGYDIYTDPKWSDPFEPDGSLDLTGIVVANTMVMDELEVETFPNPVVTTLTISGDIAGATVEVMNISGQVLQQFEAPSNQVLIDVQGYPSGVLLVRVTATDKGTFVVKRVVKQ